MLLAETKIAPCWSAITPMIHLSALSEILSMTWNS